MVRLRGHGVARRLRVAVALLKIKTAQVGAPPFDACDPEQLLVPLRRCDDVPSEAGVEHLRFSADCDTADLEPAFCARPDALAFMFEKAAKTQAAQIEVMQKMADNYLELASCDGYKLDAASASWEALAVNVFTLLVTALLMRCCDDSAAQKALHRSMTLPSEVKLRSWPSKRQLELLRQCWAERTEEEKVVLTTLSGPRMWWAHNCDYVLGAREVRDYVTILLPRTRLLRTTEDEVACKSRLDFCRKQAGLEHFAGLEDNWGAERMFFTRDFFRQPRALDWLLKRALPQLSSRNELVRMVDAVTCPFELSSAAYRLISQDTLSPAPTWRGLAAVIYTLVLDAILVRCESHRALEAAFRQRALLRSEAVEASASTAAQRSAKAKRRRQAKRAAVASKAKEKLPGATMQTDVEPQEEEEALEQSDGEATASEAQPDDAASQRPEAEDAAQTGAGFAWTASGPTSSSRPSRAAYGGRWCDSELPVCAWFVRNTFVDVDLDADSAPQQGAVCRSCSWPATTRG